MQLKPIRSEDKKNMKITFYLSEQLYSNYKDLQKRAKSKGYRLDMSGDFSHWFARQIEQAEKAIQKIENK